MKNINIVSCRLVKDKSIKSDIQITTPGRAVNLILNSFNDLDRECLFVINCDNKLKPNNINIVSVGTNNQTIADPKEIFKTTILSNSSRIFIMHNHPSEILNPSKEDLDVFNKLQSVGNILGIECIDSIIFNYSKEIYSIRANKKISIDEINNICLFEEKIDIKNDEESEEDEL